ncbi:hypothetical protein QQS21_001254 [Conoideocrella luteorostrata]|uniref:Uncharacterized protein n=1 Tax=Conoideocrella luteorostrata TaxID=1105319 RepID=A0AAJ0D0Y3_9HYPO|nr:hypothetical protein QQS21_001254 [Conoideocrella luteorostrata]
MPVLKNLSAGPRSRKSIIDGKDERKYKVNTTVALEQAIKAGVNWRAAGKHFPKRFYNKHKRIRFGIPTCDKLGAKLIQWPIYPSSGDDEEGKSKFHDDSSEDKVPNTPMRVVYVSCKGAPVLCGVVVNTMVDHEDKGFLKYNLCGSKYTPSGKITF